MHQTWKLGQPQIKSAVVESSGGGRRQAGWQRSLQENGGESRGTSIWIGKVVGKCRACIFKKALPLQKTGSIMARQVSRITPADLSCLTDREGSETARRLSPSKKPLQLVFWVFFFFPSFFAGLCVHKLSASAVWSFLHFLFTGKVWCRSVSSLCGSFATRQNQLKCNN